MPSERDTLEAAAVAAPGDDTPRLVYADWLDDRGEPDLAAELRADGGADLVRAAGETGQPVAAALAARRAFAAMADAFRRAAVACETVASRMVEGMRAVAAAVARERDSLREGQ